MKRSLQAFSIAFAVFFTVGFLEAREQRKHEDDAHTLLVFTAQYFDPFPEQTSSGRQSRFIYRCKGEARYEYDIESGLFEDPHPERIYHPTKSSLSNVEIISVVTGLKATEVIRMISAGEGFSSREIIASILGALSGYHLGRWAGSYTQPPCDSPQISSKLQDGEFRKGIGRALIERELGRYIIIETDNSASLTSRDSLLSLLKGTQTLRDDPREPLSDRVLLSPKPPSRQKVNHVCEQLADLQRRLQAPDYRANSRDFEIANYSFFLRFWLSRNIALRTTAFPHFYRIVDYRDLETSSLKLLESCLSVADSGLVRSVYIAMFIFGSIATLFMFVTGLLSIWEWAVHVYSK